MAAGKFELLKQLSGKSFDQSPEEKIKHLQQLVQQYRDENNRLVEHKWTIDIQLTTLPKPTSDELLEEQRRIEQEILAAGYPQKIASLLATIHDMEIALYGRSQVGSNSPYCL